MPDVPASLILAVDTTSESGSVALLRDGELVAVMGSRRPGMHSHALHEDVDFVLRRAGVALEKISLFAVATGPGSFTGVRVGLSAIKGFAHTLSKPALGIGALDALAYSAGVSGFICACRDALRGELYAQRFSVMPEGELCALEEPRILSPESLIASLEEDPLFFICDAPAPLVAALRGAAAHRGRALTPMTHVPPTARGWVLLERPAFLAPAIAALAARRAARGSVSDAATLDALYVRPSDAEVRWRTRHDPLSD